MAVPEFYSGKILYPAIVVLLALSALFGLAILPRLAPGDGGMVGKPAPAFSLPVTVNGDVGGQMSVADLKGRPVIIDFWATWCGPCAIEAPVLDRLARRYAKKGLVVVGVNASDTPAAMKQYAVAKGLSYPMVADAGARVSDQYGVKKLPSLVVIDREGRVLSYLVGLVDEAALTEIIGAAL